MTLLHLGVLSAAVLVLLSAQTLTQTPTTPVEWDQKRVTALAEELRKKLDSRHTITYMALDTTMGLGTP